MNFQEALKIAKSIQNNRPNFMLCGSTALILSGRIPTRDVHDIDFITTKEEVEKMRKQRWVLITEEDEYPTITTDDYTCYNVMNDNEYFYNLFILNSSEVKSEIVKGVLCQDIDQIVHFKKIFGREKDREDLKNDLGRFKIKRDCDIL